MTDELQFTPEYIAKCRKAKGGEWVLSPRDGKVQIGISGFSAWWLTDQQVRDLAAALQVWVECNAKTESVEKESVE